jgi:hypothetical protein
MDQGGSGTTETENRRAIMTNNTHKADRDDVLFAFHQAYERPTAQQIIEWANRYPEFAEDIRAHAAVSYDWAANQSMSEEQPSEDNLASAFSRALSAIYEAELEVAEAAQSTQTLRDIATACGKDVPSLQNEIGGSIGIARTVLADLFNGAMLGPLSNRLASAIQRALALTVTQFEAALERTLLAPRMGHANANAPPNLIQRTCEEIIKNSGMTPTQIRHWLDES